MLILTLTIGGSVIVGEGDAATEVCVLSSKGDRVKIGVKGPQRVVRDLVDGRAKQARKDKVGSEPNDL